MTLPLDAVAALVAEDPTIGSPAVAARLGQQWWDGLSPRERIATLRSLDEQGLEATPAAAWAAAGITEYAARKALRRLGHTGRPGPKRPAPLDPARWLRHRNAGMVLAAAGEALVIRAEQGAGLTAEEAGELGRVLREAAGQDR